MSKEYYCQGDVLYFDFGTLEGNEIGGIRPAVVLSTNTYSKHTHSLIVLPVTTRGTNFNCYVPLYGYKNVHGRVNTAQIYSFSTDRARSMAIDHLTFEDFRRVRLRTMENIL